MGTSMIPMGFQAPQIQSPDFGKTLLTIAELRKAQEEAAMRGLQVQRLQAELGEMQTIQRIASGQRPPGGGPPQSGQPGMAGPTFPMGPPPGPPPQGPGMQTYAELQSPGGPGPANLPPSDQGSYARMPGPHALNNPGMTTPYAMAPPTMQGAAGSASMPPARPMGPIPAPTSPPPPAMSPGGPGVISPPRGEGSPGPSPLPPGVGGSEVKPAPGPPAAAAPPQGQAASPPSMRARMEAKLDTINQLLTQAPLTGPRIATPMLQTLQHELTMQSMLFEQQKSQLQTYKEGLSAVGDAPEEQKPAAYQELLHIIGRESPEMARALPQAYGPEAGAMAV